MDLRQQRVLQSLRRVQSWCVANPGLVAAPVGPPARWSPLTRLLDGVHTVVTVVTEAAMRQGVQAKQATLEASDEPALRKHLREEMHAIAQVAQALRKTVPGIGIIRMPPSGTQVEGLLKAADALSKLASTYEAVLVEHGATPDFRAQLGDAISALRASVDARGAARASRVSATRAVAENIALGHRCIALMDAALTKTLRTTPAKLAEWKNAKRVTLKGVPQLGIAGMSTSRSSSTVTTPTVVPAAAEVATPASPPASVPTGAPEREVQAA